MQGQVNGIELPFCFFGCSFRAFAFPTFALLVCTAQKVSRLKFDTARFASVSVTPPSFCFPQFGSCLHTRSWLLHNVSINRITSIHPNRGMSAVSLAVSSRLSAFPLHMDKTHQRSMSCRAQKKNRPQPTTAYRYSLQAERPWRITGKSALVLSNPFFRPRLDLSKTHNALEAYHHCHLPLESCNWL